MPFDPNDPRLTALALGELPEDERLAIEAEIADDPEATAALAEIAATAQLLTDQFRLESELTGNGLDPAQKKAIEDCLAGNAPGDVSPTHATLPFRPSPLAKPSDLPASVPPARSRYPLRVAAGIVALGAVAAGVVALKRSEFSPLATTSTPTASLPSRNDTLGAVQDQTPSLYPPGAAVESSPPPAMLPPMAAPAASRPLDPQERLLAESGAAVPSNASALDDSAMAGGGGGAGMMGGQAPGSSRGLPPLIPRSRPDLNARAAPSPAGGKAMSRTDGIESRAAGGQVGQSDPQNHPGTHQFGLARSEYGGLKGEMSPTGAVARSNGKPESPAPPTPEPVVVSAGASVTSLVPKAPTPAKPGQPSPPTSSNTARPDDVSANAKDPKKAQDRMAVGDLANAQDPFRFEYRRVESLAKQLKDVPADAPVEIKLRADRLQRESTVMLEQLKLAEAKPDRRALDFEAQKHEVERFGKELQEVAQQVEEAKKVQVNDEEFGRVQDNPFQVVNAAPLSTFSVDVDTASYANVRRFLNQNSLPPRDAVRIEELLNYFTYDDPAPMASSREPFSLNVESAACPWSETNRLVRIGLKGKAVADDKRPASNLVFLVDVSGSMADLDKLPLLKAAMKLLVDNLGENDRVAIVTYANGVRVALPSTPCHRKPEILSVLEGLEAGGGTNGAGGIQRAYEIAIQSYIKGGTNRVLLATDGDFNVGISDTDELVKMIQEKAKSGVFLGVLGFGQGNLKDEKMEQLADKGNGQYNYIDSIAEARKVLVRQMGGTLVTIAKDVKVQVEFNPDKVAAYRLVGYENRMLQAQDFRDDRKDAGEIGAGLSVTALYEIVPAVVDPNAGNNVRLRFQNDQNRGKGSPEWLHVAIRYKAPDGDVSTEFGKDLVDDGRPFARASNDLKFASAVAGFGMLLRDSPYKGRLTWPAVEELTLSGLGNDSGGYRHEFQGLVKKAASLAKP